MKKAFLIMTALVVIASFAFAEDAAAPAVTIGAWGRGIFVPVMGVGGDILSTDTVSWGAAPRIGITIKGTSANAGFQADINNDNISVSCGDQQKVWIKPIDQVTVQVGRIFDSTLRGSGSFGAWDWLRFSNMNGDDLVFGRVGYNGGQANFEVSVAPVEGVYAYVGLNGILASAPTAFNMIATGTYGIGYTIPNIGVARVQYLAQGVNVTYGTINAAFKLTAVPNLTVDVGAYIPTDMSNAANAANYTANIGLFAQYVMDPLTVNLEGSIKIQTGDMPMEIALGAAYTVDKTNNIGIEAEVLYQNATKAAIGGSDAVAADTFKMTPGALAKAPITYANGQIGFLLGITKGFSNGSIGIGFEGTTANLAGLPRDKKTTDAFAWAVPVRLQYSF